MSIRLGDLLVRKGVLTDPQRQSALEYQRLTGRPFGEIVERLYHVSPAAVEDAWSIQYASLARNINPLTEEVDSEVLSLLDRRQAWQFRLLPLRYDEHELMVCTTREHLVRAMKFAGWKLTDACYFVLAQPLALGEALVAHYPMAGMTPDMVEHGILRAG
jgi:hypothetical protein